MRQRYERAAACVDELAARHPGGRIALVAHSGVLDGLFRRALELPLGAERRFSLLNASISRLSVAAGRWRLVSWGQVSHLRGLPTMDDW